MFTVDNILALFESSFLKRKHIYIIAEYQCFDKDKIKKKIMKSKYFNYPSMEVLNPIMVNPIPRLPAIPTITLLPHQSTSIVFTKSKCQFDVAYSRAYQALASVCLLRHVQNKENNLIDKNSPVLQSKVNNLVLTQDFS